MSLQQEISAFPQDWLLWRYAYTGGRPFINRYLKQFERENSTSFDKRKQISYSPSFAKGIIDEIRNSIYERMSSIVRRSENKIYKACVEGLLGGVDFKSSTMNYYIGTKILPELLVMGKVAICVDNIAFPEGVSVADTANFHPYLYYFPREQIGQITRDQYNNLTRIELTDYIFDDTNAAVTRNRIYELIDGQVHLTLTNTNQKIILNIPKIPVIIAELSNSLMEDISHYQVALLNLSSSDINFIHEANFPFYVEKYDAIADMVEISDKSSETGSAQKEIRVGTGRGRRIPNQFDFPQFIHPSPEPLLASMEKQEQMKKEMRALVNLTLSNLTTARKSAESKQEDTSAEETGLSYIGLELQAVENQIIELWNLYENKRKTSDEVIIYPNRYSLKTTQELLDEAGKLIEHSKSICSKTYRKEIMKQAVNLVFENRLSSEVISTIYGEIDSTDVVIADPEVVVKDVETGLCSLEYASSTVRGYPKGEVEKAKQEHAERLARIAESQSKATEIKGNAGARGLDDLSDNPSKDAKEEKEQSRDRTTDIDNTSKVRGKGE